MFEKYCTECHTNHMTNDEDALVCEVCKLRMTREEKYILAQKMRDNGMPINKISRKMGMSTATIWENTMPKKEVIDTSDWEVKPRDLDYARIAARL